MNKIIIFLFFVTFSKPMFAQETLQTVTSNGNTTTNAVKILSGLDVGDHYDPVKYGVLQIARPANQGNMYHLSFIRAGQMVYGMGFLNNSDVFAIQPGGSNAHSEGFFLNAAGNVGIGTMAADQRLTIKGGGIGFDHNAQDKKLYSPSDGVLEWFTHNLAAEHAFAVSHQGQKSVYLNTNGISYLNGGNVGIGTTTPQEKLSVNGKIRAHEIKVETANWPDYVFEEAYKAKTLAEIEQFIKANKHLPEVPSAKAVEKDGVALGEMNKILLKKIEELTLLLIEQNKKNEQQDQLIEKLLNKRK